MAVYIKLKIGEKEYECRNHLYIYEKKYYKNIDRLLKGNPELKKKKPQLLAIMMNPGSSVPPNDNYPIKNNCEEIRDTEPVDVEEPDDTQYQIMRIMKKMKYKYARVINISDLRNPNEKNKNGKEGKEDKEGFKEQLKTVHEISPIHSIFSEKRKVNLKMYLKT